MSAPAVSVVMAVHNSGPFLREALASLRWQTFQRWECICVDDGSTDSTPEILQDFAAGDSRFRILRQEKSGITAALTRGDNAARSDVIARMDSDDVAHPDRLKLQWQHLQSHPECVGVGAQVMLIDPSGASIGIARHAEEHAEIERRLLAAQGGTIAHPTLMFRHAAAEQVGGHRSQYEWAHDADLLVRLAMLGKLANLPEVLLLYRQHPRNTCRTRHAEIRSQMLGLLREAYEARQREMPSELETRLMAPSVQSALAGKWARRAARNGFPKTAWALWRSQLAKEPTSLTTWRCGVEALLRGVIALGTGHMGQHLSLPNWREWDCRPDTPQSVAAA